MAGQITFTPKSKYKLHRTGLLLIHNGFRFIIRRFRKVLDTFICVLSTKVCFVLTVSTCCTVHMFIFGFGCNNFLFAGKGSGRNTSILAGRVTGRIEIYPKPGLWLTFSRIIYHLYITCQISCHSCTWSHRCPAARSCTARCARRTPVPRRYIKENVKPTMT